MVVWLNINYKIPSRVCSNQRENVGYYQWHVELLMIAEYADFAMQILQNKE